MIASCLWTWLLAAENFGGWPCTCRLLNVFFGIGLWSTGSFLRCFFRINAVVIRGSTLPLKKASGTRDVWVCNCKQWQPGELHILTFIGSTTSHRFHFSFLRLKLGASHRTVQTTPEATKGGNLQTWRRTRHLWSRTHDHTARSTCQQLSASFFMSKIWTITWCIRSPPTFRGRLATQSFIGERSPSQEFKIKHSYFKIKRKNGQQRKQQPEKCKNFTTYRQTEDCGNKFCRLWTLTQKRGFAHQPVNLFLFWFTSARTGPLNCAYRFPPLTLSHVTGRIFCSEIPCLTNETLFCLYWSWRFFVRKLGTNTIATWSNAGSTACVSMRCFTPTMFFWFQ